MNKWVRYRLGHNGNYSTWCFPTQQNFENSCPSTFLPTSSVGGHRSILREGWIRALKRVGFRSKDACVPSHLLLSFLTMDKLLDFSHFLIWNMYNFRSLWRKQSEMLPSSTGRVQADAWRRLGAGPVAAVAIMVVLVPAVLVVEAELMAAQAGLASPCSFSDAWCLVRIAPFCSSLPLGEMGKCYPHSAELRAIHECLFFF